jgi:hypothetical protein
MLNSTPGTKVGMADGVEFRVRVDHGSDDGVSTGADLDHVDDEVEYEDEEE